MSDKRDFVVGMLVGSAIGAAVALLYAPQAGDATRDLIKQKAGEAKDKAGDMASTAKDKASELASTAKDKASTVAGTISSTVAEKTTAVRDSAAGVVGQVKSTAQDLVDRGRSLVETQKQQVTAAVKSGQQAYQDKRSELEAEVQEDLDTSPAGIGSTGTAPAA
jgi:gas vesicle protein